MDSQSVSNTTSTNTNTPSPSSSTQTQTHPLTTSRSWHSSEKLNVDDMETNKILKTKKEIEEEFKNLVFLHTHEEKNNDNTIFNETRLNGAFENTYIIREVDDTFIFFPHVIHLVQDLKDFWTFYDSHKDNNNILIDSRLINYIAYATIKYGEDLLIYDSYTSKIKSIYFFCSDYFKIQTNELTINQIKQLFIIYLLIYVFSRQMNISWNINNLIKCIKSNDYNINIKHNPTLNIFDIIINYIKIQTPSEVNSANIMKILQHFDNSFSIKAYLPETAPELKEWDLEGISGYEFYVAISVLKNNDFRLM